MSGSIVAAQIEADLKREKYYKHKLIRRQCYQDNIKKCMNCQYQKICTDVEIKGEKECKEL